MAFSKQNLLTFSLYALASTFVLMASCEASQNVALEDIEGFSSSSNLTSIENLPEEVVSHVFSFLNKRDILPVSRVSHCWNSLIDDNKLWHGYAQRSRIIDKNGPYSPERSYKELVRFHCTPAFKDLSNLVEANELDLNYEIEGITDDGMTLIGRLSSLTPGIFTTRTTDVLTLEKKDLEGFFPIAVSADGAQALVSSRESEDYAYLEPCLYNFKNNQISPPIVPEINSGAYISTGGTHVVRTIEEVYETQEAQHKMVRSVLHKGSHTTLLGNKNFSSIPVTISRDGSHIVCFEQDQSNSDKGLKITVYTGENNRSVIHTQEADFSYSGGGPLAISEDCSVIVTNDNTLPGCDTERAMLLKIGLDILGTVKVNEKVYLNLEDIKESYATHVNFDGSVVAGHARFNDLFLHAVLWEQEKEGSKISDLLRKLKLLPAQWENLSKVSAMIPSGTLMVGEGVKYENESRLKSFWLAVIPKPNLF